MAESKLRNRTITITNLSLSHLLKGEVPAITLDRAAPHDQCSQPEAIASGRYQFTQWVGYYAQLYGVACVAVPPHFTTQDCSGCGARVEKSLSTRTHKCTHCGTALDRDHNAAINILVKGLMMIAEHLKNTVGHTGINAQGEEHHWLVNGDVGLLSELVMKELGIDVCLESRAVP